MGAKGIRCGKGVDKGREGDQQDPGLPSNYNEVTRLVSDLSASSPSGHTCFLKDPCPQLCFLSRFGHGLPGCPLPRPAECLASSCCGRVPGTDSGFSFLCTYILSVSLAPKTTSVLHPHPHPLRSFLALGGSFTVSLALIPTRFIQCGSHPTLAL